ncbi:MAG: HAD family phosphatase [Aeromonadales bacterium]|nr:HAD family phosphatase [Aeromonadales bacterium]
MAKYTLENLPIEYDKYKVIALDLDDTLLRSDKSISQFTIDTLQKAQKQGISIAIATGRHPKSAVKFMKALGCLNDDSYAVCFNGAGVVRLSEYVKHDHHIGFPMVCKDIVKGPMIRKLTHFAHEHGCKVHAYSVTDGLLIEDHNPFTQKEIDNAFVGFKAIDFTKVADDAEFFKILIVGEVEKLEALRPLIPQEFKDFFGIVRSEKHYLEFIPNHATKGTGLEHLCKALGYGIENSMAFGDAENDLAMIEAAGLGVAMSNGFEIIKEAADVITKTNDEDGVAFLVNKFLK